MNNKIFSYKFNLNFLLNYYVNKLYLQSNISFYQNKIFISNFFYKMKYFSYNSVFKYFELTKSICFLQFKIIGLGFKVKKKSYKNIRLLKLDLGFSHYNLLKMPNNIKLLKGKKKFFFISNNKIDFYSFINCIKVIKPMNIYKIKGLKDIKKIYKLKPGKQKTKK